MPDGTGPGFALLYILIVLVLLGAIVAAAVVTRRRAAAPTAKPKAARPKVRKPPPRAKPKAPPSKKPKPSPPGAKTVDARVDAAPPVDAVPPVEAPAPVATAPERVEQVPPLELPEIEAPPGLRPLRERLARARGSFGEALVRLFRKGSLTDADWEDLEAVLLQADVGVVATRRIVGDLQAKAKDADPEGLLAMLRSELLAILGDQDRALRTRDGLSVWLITGVNGTGKTTTIGKLALREHSGGRRVVLAAADTFRAAADTQLELWAARSGAEVVKHAPGADPAAVAYDGVQAAKARGADLLIVDTAGRLHTKRNLMDELSKIRRVVERESGPPSEVLLVLDATTGQNGIAQARAFTEAVDVTGIVLTKLDGTAKGGIVIAVQQELGIPVKLVGVGESAEDLEPFDPAAFVDALVG